MKHTFEIGDGEGNSFKILVEMPFHRWTKGSWRTLDKGYIRYNSGETQPSKGFGGNDDDLFLLSKNGYWGLRLDDVQDFWGLNDQGKGELIEPWVLIMKPGTISWSLV